MMKSSKSHVTRLVALTTVLLLSFDVSAQDITYEHDESFCAQFLIGETGAGGSLNPSTYYDVFHKSYANTAYATNKAVFRESLKQDVKVQEPYSESVDTCLVSRAEIEALNMSDRLSGGPQALAAWSTEKGKIEGYMDKLKKIGLDILSNGGPQKGKEYYDMKYKMMESAIDNVQNAYMPSSERQKQFLLIYNDLKKTVEAGRRDIIYYRAVRQCRIYKEKNDMKRAHIREIADASRLRWTESIPSPRSKK